MLICPDHKRSDCGCQWEIVDQPHAAGGKQLTRSNDPVNHPRHYTFGGIEVIDAIEAWALGFHRGNAVKYIARAGRKGDEVEDLRKARWYLDREIARLEAKR